MLFAEFLTRYQAQMNAHAFLSGKLLEMRQRHNKYESTPYSLEPNCKESPGGLRDLHTMIWLARAAGLGSSWQALAGKGPRWSGSQRPRPRRSAGRRPGGPRAGPPRRAGVRVSG